MSRKRDPVRGEPGRESERRSTERPSEAVIAAVAESTDQAPLEMTPLAEAIDPEALDALVRTTDDDSSVAVTFEYCGERVSVTSSEVQVER